jgi:hypothetical protein
VHRNALTKFVAEGMPVVQAGAKGTPWVFDLRACVQWWGRRGRNTDADLDVTAERARLAKEQADAQALKNAEARGELVRGELIEAWLVRLLGAVAQRIRAIAPKAAPETRATGTDAEAEALLSTFHDEALAEIADAVRDAAGAVARMRSRPADSSGGGNGSGTEAAASGDGERVGGPGAEALAGVERGAGSVADVAG